MSDYLLGMAPAEIERLRRQHDTWRVQTRRAWKVAEFCAGQTLVDLGCGPGFTSIELANVVGPHGRVIAVDASAVATAELQRSVTRSGVANVEVVTSDVCDADLAAWNPDGVFARWLFSFLPDPEGAIRRMAAGLRPGAMVVVMDYWNYLAIRSEPDSPLFRRVFRAVYDSFADAGGSLDVAGGLVGAFHRAGLRVTVVEPFSQVGQPGTPVWQWIEEFLALYLPTLVEGGAIAAADVSAFWRWWGEQSARPDAFVFAPPILCVVAVKEQADL